jgi:hypothetical protein
MTQDDHGVGVQRRQQQQVSRAEVGYKGHIVQHAFNSLAVRIGQFRRADNR